jgi:hypothetical protein
MESNTSQSITINCESNGKKRKFHDEFRTKTCGFRLTVSKSTSRTPGTTERGYGVEKLDLACQSAGFLTAR